MKSKWKTALASLAMMGTALTGMAATGAEAKPKQTGEQKLAKMLEGRVAGEPRSCIFTTPSSSIRVIDDTALVYRSGGTLWVNVPADPSSLDDDDIMVVRRTGSQLCNLDVITTVDRYSGFYNGNVFLGDFVPYRKVKSGS